MAVWSVGRGNYVLMPPKKSISNDLGLNGVMPSRCVYSAIPRFEGKMPLVL